VSTVDPVALLAPLPKAYTRQEALSELDELYAQLPALDCRGLCHDSCTVVPASELEYQRIAEAGATIGPRMSGRRVRELIAAGRSLRCPALGPLNNCTIYPIRPFICRAFGVAVDLRCQHGCIPDKILPNGEVTRVMAKIEQLSRHVTGVRAWPTR
jgi:Fe-S-cluster containining protein